MMKKLLTPLVFVTSIVFPKKYLIGWKHFGIFNYLVKKLVLIVVLAQNEKKKNLHVLLFHKSVDRSDEYPIFQKWLYYEVKLETTIVNNYSAYCNTHLCQLNYFSGLIFSLPNWFFIGQKTMGTSIYWAFRTFQFNLYLSWPILGGVRNQKWKNSCIWIIVWIQMFTFNCHFGPS